MYQNIKKNEDLERTVEFDKWRSHLKPFREQSHCGGESNH